MRKKPDTVERTVHLFGWVMVFAYFLAFVRVFIPPGTGVEGLTAVFYMACPLVGFCGFGWAFLGLYRWFRDR